MTSIIFKIVETLIWNVNAANTKQLSGPEKLTGLLRNRPQDIGYFQVPPGLCIKTRLGAQPFVTCSSPII